MSLLMDALRRAEEEKRRAAERAAAEAASQASATDARVEPSAMSPGEGVEAGPVADFEGELPAGVPRAATEEFSLEPIAATSEAYSHELSPRTSPEAEEALDRPDDDPVGSSTIERALAALGLPDATGEGIDPEATRESVKQRESPGETTLPSERALRSSLRDYFDTSQSVDARGSIEGTSPTVLREVGGTGPNRRTGEAPEATPQAVDHRTGRSERVSAQAVLTAAHRSSSSRVFTLLVVGLFIVATALGAIGFYYYAQIMPAPSLAASVRSAAQFESPLPPEALRPPTDTSQDPTLTTAEQTSPATATPAAAGTAPASAMTGEAAGATTAASTANAASVTAVGGSAAAPAASAQTSAPSAAGLTEPAGVAAIDAGDAPDVAPDNPGSGLTPAAGAALAAAQADAVSADAVQARPATATAAIGPAADTTRAASEGSPQSPPATPVAPAPARSAEARLADDAPVLMAPAGAPPIGAAVRITRARREAALPPGLLDAYAAWRRGDLDAAERGYRSVIQAQPDARDALLGLAGVAVARGQTREAARLYGEVLRRDPRDSIASAGLHLLQAGEGPAVDAASLELMLDEEPAAAHLHFALGNHHARAQRWREAQAAYFNAWRLEVDNPDYAFNLAVALDQLNQAPAATEYYRRALSNATRSRLAPAFDRASVEARLRSLQTAAAP